MILKKSKSIYLVVKESGTMNKDNKKFVVESVFIKEAIKDNLSLNEFLLLLYFDNSFDYIFDMPTISRYLNMDEQKVLDAYSNLLKKRLINVKAEKNGFGKLSETVSLDNYYNNINLQNRETKKKEEKEDIYSIFETKFGRTLNGMDFEIINAWIDKGFREDLILEALDEAVYNGAANLRYIDKVLFEWHRKGIKKPEDIHKKYEEEPRNNYVFEPSLINMDWLNEK